MQSETIVELKALRKDYGGATAVHALDLVVRKGEFVAILGPSGCGKTTLLKIIGGFLEPSGGSISILGRDVTHVAPEFRPTNMVFQGYGLFPHMTVAQNVGYGLRLRKLPADVINRRVQDALK